MGLYNSYVDYLSKNYPSRVQKITVDAGFTCPNRDGTQGTTGCIYCNNESFAPVHLKNLSLTEQIRHGIETSRRRYKKAEKFLVYFQPFSNTYGPLSQLKLLYQEALDYPGVIGLSIGTRPDCVDREKIEYLAVLAQTKDITLEYGLESASHETLKKISRGHDVAAFSRAVKMTAGKGIKIAVHLIFGFPWESNTDVLAAAKLLSELPIDFVKVHQLHVIKKTPLGEEYRQKPFVLLTLEQYLETLKIFLENLSPKIVIQRLYGDAPDRLLIAPDWKLEVSEFNKLLEEYLQKSNSWQGKNLA
ncbi:MAG: TIGR01212 family radical SAM protein [Pseudomonadota bacterium]